MKKKFQPTFLKVIIASVAVLTCIIVINSMTSGICAQFITAEPTTPWGNFSIISLCPDASRHLSFGNLAIQYIQFVLIPFTLVYCILSFFSSPKKVKGRK